MDDSKRLKKNVRFLVFGGHSGWVGQKVVSLLRSNDCEVVVAESRLENRDDVAKELDSVRPSHVMNAAGLTGRPNVDWCETHRLDVLRVNVIGTLSLLELCESRNIHITNFATGCLYHYDEVYTIGGSAKVTEATPPNFYGSFYSLTKAAVENLIVKSDFKNVLQLRLRMPVSDDLHHRSLVTKLTKYEKVINIPNSVTVLHDLLPVACSMAERRRTGIFNFTNPGAISHNEILKLYKAHIDPDFVIRNFTMEEHDKVVIAKRSNTELDTSKLEKVCSEIGIELPHIQESMPRVFQRMQKNLTTSTAQD